MIGFSLRQASFLGAGPPSGYSRQIHLESSRPIRMMLTPTAACQMEYGGS